MNLHFAPEQFNLWCFIQELVIRTWNSTNNYDIWLALFIEELVIWTWNLKNWTFSPRNWTFGGSSKNRWIEPGIPRIELFHPEIELLVVHPRIGDLNPEVPELNFSFQKLNFWWFIQELVIWTWNSKNLTFPPKKTKFDLNLTSGLFWLFAKI